MSRPVSEIQSEYQQLCCKAGHLQYQVGELNSELSLVNDTLRKLNVEAFKAAEEAKTAAADTAKPVESEPAPAATRE